MRNALRGATLLVASCAVALLTSLTVSGPHGMSSQSNVHLPTTGTYTSLQAVNYMNDAWDALLTCNKGPAAPVNALGGAPKAGQCWLDDSNATTLVKKRYSGTGWVVEGVIDVANGVWTPPVGGGAAMVTAASTTDLCAAAAMLQTVTGTGAIASFGASCANGVKKTIVFQGTATLTYNATSLILPGQIDYETSAGDVVEAVALGAGNWRVTGITKINGNAVTNPAVEVGVALNYFGGAVPAKYVLGYGQALPRADYPHYVAAVTVTQTVTRSSGSNTLTSVADTSRIGSGMPIEGAGIPNGTTVTAVTSNTIVMSANASSSGSSTATVFLTGYGSGGGATTVGVPDCRGAVLAGRSNMGGTDRGNLGSAYFGADGKAMAAYGGSQSHTLTTNEIPSHTHANTLTDPGHAHWYDRLTPVGGGSFATASPFVGLNTSTSSTASTTGITITNASAGGGQAHSIIQPTVVADCLIRVLAMRMPSNDRRPFSNRSAPLALDRRFS